MNYICSLFDSYIIEVYILDLKSEMQHISYFMCLIVV